MRAVGLITEYNPFHNGHRYHIQQAKQLTQADVVIAMMSGNYVQRGEPAIFNKWQRAEIALNQGVDIVLELPFAYAVQPAHLFAYGAVKLLAAIGVADLVFGAEHADYDFGALARAAKTVTQDHEHFQSDYRQTFASQFNQLLVEQLGVDLTKPNDLLGFAYAQARLDLNLADQIQLHPIQRQQAQYHDVRLPFGGQIASATALRRQIEQGKGMANVAQYVAPQMLALAKKGPEVHPFAGAWFDALRYQVLTSSVAQLETIYQLNDGLAPRLKKLVDYYQGASYEDFLAQFKSRRYTKARMQRLLLYTVLQVRPEQIQAVWQHPYLRLLGVTARGQQYLHERKKKLAIPLISRVTQEDVQGRLQLDYQVGKVYQHFARQALQQQFTQDTGRQPIIRDKKEK